jgi:hypothetical protein
MDGPNYAQFPMFENLRSLTMTTKTPSIPDPKTISRREFLYYVWTASAALLGAEAVGAGVWFSTPRYRQGIEEGFFKLDVSDLPIPGEQPIGIPAGKFWLANTYNGLLALSMRCTKLSEFMLFKWVPANGRFECPGCGSKYALDGTKLFVEGPAPRSLDRYIVEVKSPSGTRWTPADGSPVAIHDATEIIVHTRYLIAGKPAGNPYR